MEHRPLGRSGLSVSELCLGTMTFGDETDEAEAHAMMDAYAEAGGTFIDTADVYSAGVSEEIVGRWVGRRSDRDRFVVATKARFPLADDAGPNDRGLSRAYLTRALHASLRRLGGDHVDLYQVHAWDPTTPLEETLATMDDFVHRGLVRYWGVSNFAGWQLERAVLLARMHGWAEPVSLQPQYNLLAREIEWELVPVCLAEAVGILPWSPLGGGWLTGKYRRDERPTGATRLGEDPDRGLESYDKRNTERTWSVVDALMEVADAHNVTPAQVALRWVTDRPGVASTILGARTLAQLEDNLQAADLRLEPDAVVRLDAVSAPPTPEYPYLLLDDVAGR